MKKIELGSLLLLLFLAFNANAQNAAQDTAKKEPKKSHWYDKIALRGYTQVRYNRLLETNPKYKNEQGDRSIGENGSVFLRRIRLIFSGNVHDRVYIYIQPDFASSASSTSLHFGQMRDAYFDLALDAKKEFRFRFGQSKVPFGFENLQSSQNRLALDRNDALNSALSNERDLGVFFYWAPDHIRKRFAELVSSGLKGSGDYGVFGLGAYNGQVANKPDANNNMHVVSRISYPFMFSGGQFIEAGIQAYSGVYTLTTEQRSKTTTNTVSGTTVKTKDVFTAGPMDFTDQRLAGSIMVYPQPFGFQAEYNIGRGPEFDKTTMAIEEKNLKGGYAQLMYMMKIKNQVIIPFVKSQYYFGGKKHETDARRYRVTEHEIGVEWQPIPNFELVAIYTMGDRRFEDAKILDNRQVGNLLRLQVQFNY